MLAARRQSHSSSVLRPSRASKRQKRWETTRPSRLHGTLVHSTEIPKNQTRPTDNDPLSQRRRFPTKSPRSPALSLRERDGVRGCLRCPTVSISSQSLRVTRRGNVSREDAKKEAKRGSREDEDRDSCPSRPSEAPVWKR